MKQDNPYLGSWNWNEDSIKEVLQEKYIDMPKVLSFVGIETQEEWDAMDILSRTSDLIAYYGEANILGSTYTHVYKEELDKIIDEP